jgi:Fe-S-cluster containining protein
MTIKAIKENPLEKALAKCKALQIQTALDYNQKLRQEGFILSCAKKCSYCCKHPFLVTIVEGFLIYQGLVQNNLWTSLLQKELKGHREKVNSLYLSTWLLSNISCPFLENNECVIYNERPLHCRVTYSTGDSLLCHPHELGYGAGLMKDSEEVILEYNQKLQMILRKLDLVGALLPISQAVLLVKEYVDL